jgi:hypothetical protein
MNCHHLQPVNLFLSPHGCTPGPLSWQQVKLHAGDTWGGMRRGWQDCSRTFFPTWMRTGAHNPAGDAGTAARRHGKLLNSTWIAAGVVFRAWALDYMDLSASPDSIWYWLMVLTHLLLQPQFQHLQNENSSIPPLGKGARLARRAGDGDDQVPLYVLSVCSLLGKICEKCTPGGTRQSEALGPGAPSRECVDLEGLGLQGTPSNRPPRSLAACPGSMTPVHWLASPGCQKDYKGTIGAAVLSLLLSPLSFPSTASAWHI